MIRWCRAAGVLALAGAVAACGGGESSSAPTTAPLSVDQQNRLAGVLVDNLESGGVAFVASARSPSGDTITLTGEVDWVDHRGRAMVSASGPEQDLAEVIWTIDTILERRPALSDRLAAEAGVAAAYVARAPSPATRPIDRVVAIIAALAGERRDNPLLIATAEGSASLGTSTVQGREVEILRYGRENRYSFDLATGELVRFEQPPTGDRDAIVIDLTSRGPRTIALPSPDTVVAADALGELYPFPLG